MSAAGQGATYRARAEREFAFKKPTTEQAFLYAVVAVNDRLRKGGVYGLTSDLSPARLYLNRAPLVRAPETARLQIILFSLVEQRPDVVARCAEIVRRFATKNPNDLDGRYYSAMLLANSGQTKDQLWAVNEAEQLAKRWPSSPLTGHAGMHATFSLWLTTHRDEDRLRAVKAARTYETILIKEGRTPERPRRVLKVLLKDKAEE